MDDITTYILLTASFFFVALGFALLVRYRQVSHRINTSTDLGRDLWSSLEQRLKKQDERILDMMGRLEVVQSRVMTASSHGPPGPTLASASSVSSIPSVANDIPVEIKPNPVIQQSQSRESESPPSPPTPTSGVKLQLDETQLRAMSLLNESPKNTRQLTDSLKRSREHTARIMKGLFEAGLVTRNDSTKPFVYQLTDEGKRLLSSP